MIATYGIPSRERLSRSRLYGLRLDVQYSGEEVCGAILGLDGPKGSQIWPIGCLEQPFSFMGSGRVARGGRAELASRARITHIGLAGRMTP